MLERPDELDADGTGKGDRVGVADDDVELHAEVSGILVGGEEVALSVGIDEAGGERAIGIDLPAGGGDGLRAVGGVDEDGLLEAEIEAVEGAEASAQGQVARRETRLAAGEVLDAQLLVAVAGVKGVAKIPVVIVAWRILRDAAVEGQRLILARVQIARKVIATLLDRSVVLMEIGKVEGRVQAVQRPALIMVRVIQVPIVADSVRPRDVGERRIEIRANPDAFQRAEEVALLVADVCVAGAGLRMARIFEREVSSGEEPGGCADAGISAEEPVVQPGVIVGGHVEIGTAGGG